MRGGKSKGQKREEKGREASYIYGMQWCAGVLGDPCWFLPILRLDLKQGGEDLNWGSRRFVRIGSGSVVLSLNWFLQGK